MADENKPRRLEDIVPKTKPPVGQREFHAAGGPMRLDDLIAEKERAVAPAKNPIEELPRFLRQVGVAGVGIGAGLGTAGLGSIPALGIEAASMGGADLVMRALGLRSPGEEVLSPESAEIAATTLLTGGVVRGAFHGIGLLGGVGKEGLEEAARRGPIGAARFVKTAGERAEQVQAREFGQKSVELLKGGGKRLEHVAKAEAIIDSIDESAQGLPVVRTQLLKDYMQTLKRTVRLPEHAVENQALDEMAELLPERMTLRELTEYIRDLRRPVEEQIGKLTKVPVSASQRIQVAHGAAQIRDMIAGTEAARAFKASSVQIDAIKKFRKMVLDPKGELKPTAEGMWGRVMNRRNHIVSDTLKKFQEQTGLKAYDKALELAKKRQWDPPDEKVAVFILSIIARMIRGAARSTAKGMSVVLNPLTVAPLAGATETGQALVGAPSLELGTRAYRQAVEFGKEQYGKGKQRIEQLRQHRREERQLSRESEVSSTFQQNLEDMSVGSVAQEQAKKGRGGEPRRRGPNP